jgi:hypothetical protein
MIQDTVHLAAIVLAGRLHRRFLATDREHAGELRLEGVARQALAKLACCY